MSLLSRQYYSAAFILTFVFPAPARQTAAAHFTAPPAFATRVSRWPAFWLTSQSRIRRHCITGWCFRGWAISNQFGEDRALLVARFRDVAGYNLNPWFDAWVRSGCFMHSFNHPKVHVLADLARIACELLGLPAAEVPPQTIQSDRLALLAAHPVYPDLAAYFGVPANPLFQLPMQGSVGRSSVSLEAYLALCFRDYRSVRRRKLLGVEGMPATLAALGLDT
jgi:hypothetical protein